MLTVDKLRAKPKGRNLPHVVLLGAGASRAAFPGGDKNGKLVPLLNDIPQILGDEWYDLIEYSKAPVGNFEKQYSWLIKQNAFQQELAAIESLIEDYFTDLDLPDHPTIYDYLVMGLRPKDVIATFNWDPFLLLSHIRNRKIKKLPEIRFLHGSVNFTTCAEHDVLGTYQEKCPHCNCLLSKPKMFFPDGEKDYAQNRFIYREWTYVTDALKQAFHLTIFGYSGPDTDYKARQLLLEGWSQTPLRDISHVEIIDVKDYKSLSDCWREYVPFAHEMILSEFWQSTIALWPRRTEQYKIAASIYGIPSEFLGPFRTESLTELQDWFMEIAEAE